MNQTSSKRWCFLAIGFFVMLFVGVLYAWPILKTPLKAEFMWTESVLSLNFTLVMCFFCLGGLAAGVLSARIRPIALLTISAILIFAGFSLVSFYRGTSAMALYLSYGVCLSFGIGIAYNVIISMVSSWFPEKKGICSGILMMGFGASSMILGNIANRMISSARFGWRITFLITGAAVGLMVFLSGSVLHSANVTQSGPSSCTGIAENSLSTQQMLHTKSFWKLFAFAVTNVSVGVAIVGSSKDISLSFKASEALATSMVGTLSICNGAGRIISGILFDRAGRRNTSILGSTVNILGPALLLLAVTQGSVWLGVTAICIAGIAYGFTPPLIPSTVREFYGPRHFPSNFSVASLFLIPASFSSTVTGALTTIYGNYISSLCFLFVVAVISFGLNLTVKAGS